MLTKVNNNLYEFVLVIATQSAKLVSKGNIGPRLTLNSNQSNITTGSNNARTKKK